MHIAQLLSILICFGVHLECLEIVRVSFLSHISIALEQFTDNVAVECLLSKTGHNVMVK